MKPVDLRATFGGRYRVRWEANGATRSSWPEDERLWLLELRCRYGIVYPYGGEFLAAAADHPRLGAKLRALPFIASAKGDVETVVVFGQDHAKAVFRILKPYRRRQLSETERSRKAEILARARLQRRRESLSQSDFRALGSTNATPGEAQAAPGPLCASETAKVDVSRAAPPSATQASRRRTVGT